MNSHQEDQLHFYKKLEMLEHNADQDIERSFQWLESQRNNHKLPDIIKRSSLSTTFKMISLCYWNILQGNLVLASKLLVDLKSHDNLFKADHILLSQILIGMNQYHQAYHVLKEGLPQNETSFYCLNKMLQCCLDGGMYHQGVRWYEKLMPTLTLSVAQKADILQCASSLYFSSYDFLAATCLKKEFIDLQMSLPALPENKKHSFNLASGWQTFCDFLDLLELYGLQSFPVAGTLLGWQREGQLLATDKDLDLAFMPGTDALMFVRKIINETPRYMIAKGVVESPSYLSLIDQKTGVTIDLLELWNCDQKYALGWRLPGKYYDQSRILIFDPFTVVESEWRGRRVFRPKDADSFLTQLYGDWRKPDPYFDSVGGVKNLQKMTPFIVSVLYANISSSIGRNQFRKAISFIDTLIRYGEADPLLEKLKLWLHERIN